jgi:protein required for attachment to host cells
MFTSRAPGTITRRDRKTEAAEQVVEGLYGRLVLAAPTVLGDVTGHHHQVR